jgi:endonuclease I
MCLQATLIQKIFSMKYLHILPERRSIFFTLSVTVFLLWSQFAFSDIPSGYYDNAAGKSGSTLKTALYNIIKSDNHVSYTPGLWNAFYTTDERDDNPTKVWDMYSDIPGGSPFLFTLGGDQCGSEGVTAEEQCYAREHSFPKSWFGGEVQPMYTDLFHIVPVDQYVNNRRSNYPYAKVGTAQWTSHNGSKLGLSVTPGYSLLAFEPRDEFKGDFARNYFYMATRYENVIASWETDDTYGDYVLDGTSYPCFETWYITMLLEWNAADPVSQKEIDRNNAVYPIQNNRNPYIDHPEYVALVWQPGIPQATTLAATSVNASGATLNGTVNPSGVSTTYHFDYGLTTTYGTSTTAVSAGAGMANVSASTAVSGFSGGTTYHFRLVSVNTNATTNGKDLTFTTTSPTLSVTPSNQNVATAAGSTSFTVTSNSSWSVNSSQSWCTVTPSGSGNGTITANYTQNTTVVQRVANVTVTVAGLSPVVVTVTQAAAPPALSVTPSNQGVTAAAGSTSFSVISNTDWTVSSSQSWCTVTPSGSGNGTITANYTQNTTVVQRVANVTVTVTGLPQVVVTVTQAAAPPALSVTPSNQGVIAAAGSTSFSVTSNTDWTVSSNQSWCTVTPSGSGNGTITANYTQNTTVVQRVANVTVTVTGLTPVVVTVTQEAGAPTLSVTPSDQAVTDDAGNTSFSVTSNTGWTASSNQTWCTVTPSGSGNGTITANYTQNTSTDQRIANVTATVTGLAPVVVTVTQAGSPLPPEPDTYPTEFSGHNIVLQWTDATGDVIPAGYLILMSSNGFNDIPVPVDGVPVPDSPTSKNVAYGVQKAVFGNLLPKSTYYFKIYGYSNSGINIDYKTDGDVPQVMKTTLE